MSQRLSSRMDGEVTVDQARRALAEAVKGQAEWRQRKAEEYPDDRRNAQAAEALEGLAAHVLTLPDHDDRLRNLTMLVGGRDIFVFGQQASQALGRFGFDGPGEDADSFLDYLVGLAAEDEFELAEMAGEPPLAIAHKLKPNR